MDALFVYELLSRTIPYYYADSYDTYYFINDIIRDKFHSNALQHANILVHKRLYGD